LALVFQLQRMVKDNGESDSGSGAERTPG